MSFKLFFNVLTRTTNPTALETQYAAVYKPFLKLLYNTAPQLKVSWSFNGPELAFYRKKHPEFLTVLSELVNRGQVEITGGGYYDPLMPLTLPIDRVSQIELLTALARQYFGKKTRGITLSYNFWDDSVIDSFTRAGMEWVMLDSHLVENRENNYAPCIAENLGKSITVLCAYDTLVPHPETSPADYLASLQKLDRSRTKAFSTAVGGAVLTEKNIHALLQSGWFDAFSALDFGTSSTEIVLPSSIVRECKDFVPVCTLSGRANDRILHDEKLHNLYARIAYTEALIKQCHGDKFRKNDARENMWKAQNALTFGLAETDEAALTASRHGAYRELIEAEKICRTVTGFAKALLSIDVNYDSKKEYIYKFSAFNAFILQKNGAIYELDIFKGFTNYTENCTLFADTLFYADSEASSENRSENQNEERIEYTEFAVNHAKKEIKLISLPRDEAQKISVRKNYVASENGIQVQYIFKNAGAQKTKAVFSSAGEFSFFQKKEANFVSEAVFSDSAISPLSPVRKNLRESALFNTNVKNSKKAKIDKISLFHLEDVENNVSFSLEPNEESGFSYECTTITETITKFSAKFFWPLDLEPNGETEKTIICNIAVKPKKKV